MLDLYLRTIKERVLRPFARATPLTPNQITLVAFACGLTCAWQAAMGNAAGAVYWWAANRILDGLDGVVAREKNMQSDFGGYLDIVTDFVVYSLVPVGLVYAHTPSDATLWLVLALLLTTFFVNAAGLFQLAAILEKRSAGAAAGGELTSVTMPTGLVEGTETVVLYTLFLLFPQHVLVGFSVMALGVTLTIVQRLWWAWRHVLPTAHAHAH